MILATTLQQIEKTIIDQVPLWPTRVFNVISAVVVWVLVLFYHYWREHSKDFTLDGWWKEDKPRFIAGGVVTAALTILKATSSDVDRLLEFMGFRVTNTSGVAYGLAIAVFLLGSKMGKKKNGGEAMVNGGK